MVELKNLCSLSKERGKGVEKAIISLALEHAKSKGYTEVVLKEVLYPELESILEDCGFTRK